MHVSNETATLTLTLTEYCGTIQLQRIQEESNADEEQRALKRKRLDSESPPYSQHASQDNQDMDSCAPPHIVIPPSNICGQKVASNSPPTTVKAQKRKPAHRAAKAASPATPAAAAAAAAAEEEDAGARESTQLAQREPEDNINSEDDDEFRPQLAQDCSQSDTPSQPPLAASQQLPQRHLAAEGRTDIVAGEEEEEEAGCDMRRSLRKNVRQLHQDEKLAKMLQGEEERAAARVTAAWKEVSRSPPTLLLTGGDTKDEKGSVVTLADAYEFDSEHNCWTRLDDDAAVARCFHTAAVVDRRTDDGTEEKMLIVFGGEINTPTCKQVLAALRILCLIDRVWFNPRVTGLEPSPRSGHSCSRFGDLCVFFGGVKDDVYYNDLHVLDTKNWNWFVPNTEGEPPSARAYHVAAVCQAPPSLGGSPFMVIVGGDTPTSVESDVYRLDLMTWEWRRMTISGAVKLEPSCGHSGALLGPPQEASAATHAPTLNATQNATLNALHARFLLLHGGWGSKGKYKDASSVVILDTHEWRLCSITPDLHPPADCAGHSVTALEDGQLVALFGQAPDENLLSQMTHLRLRAETAALLIAQQQ